MNPPLRKQKITTVVNKLPRLDFIALELEAGESHISMG